MQEASLLSEVIIVDDDPVSSYLTTEILLDHASDLKVQSFNRASECLNFLRNEVDNRVILLDINMPEMDGWEFIDRFREHDLKDLIVMLTSSINGDDRARAEAQNVGFLTKPIKPEELFTIIRNKFQNQIK